MGQIHILKTASESEKEVQIQRVFPPNWNAFDYVKHWARDGGLRRVCDSVYLYVSVIILSVLSLAWVAGIYMQANVPHEKPKLHVLDTKRNNQ